MKKNNQSAEDSQRKRSMAIGGALLLLLLLFLGLWGLAKVASASTPKDALFPVKRAFENLHSAVTLGPQSRAKLALDAFNERMHEAEGLVVQSDSNQCDSNDMQAPITSENDQAIMIDINQATMDLSRAEAEAMQITNSSAKEEINANIVEMVGHHLLVWESLSKFAPVQTHSAMIQMTKFMVNGLTKAIEALPEGRRNDMTAKLQFNLDTIAADIQNGLESCGEDGSNSADGTGNGTGSGANGTGTNTRTTTTTGNSGTTGTGTRTTTGGSTGANGGSNSGNNGSNSKDALNVNVHNDAGVDVNAGVTDQGNVHVDPNVDLNPQNGTDTKADVNDSNVVNTDACPGPMVLGVCLGR